MRRRADIAAAVQKGRAGNHDLAVALHRHARRAVVAVAKIRGHQAAVIEIGVQAAVGVVAGQGEGVVAGRPARCCRPPGSGRSAGSPSHVATSLSPPKSVVTRPPLPNVSIQRAVGQEAGQGEMPSPRSAVCVLVPATRMLPLESSAMAEGVSLVPPKRARSRSRPTPRRNWCPGCRRYCSARAANCPFISPATRMLSSLSTTTALVFSQPLPRSVVTVPSFAGPKVVSGLPSASL